MNIVVFGNCEKHDFIISAAALIKTYTDKKVVIITDDDRNYRYFDGEVSGVEILTESETSAAEITIYDCHYSIPSDLSDPQIYFATSYERPSLESVRAAIEQLMHDKPQGLIIVQSESAVSDKYILNALSLDIPTVSYIDDTTRRIDWVYEGKIDFKVQRDFAESVGLFVEGVLNISSKEVKRLWTFARKRG